MVFAVELGFTFYLSYWVPQTFAVLQGQAPITLAPLHVGAQAPTSYRRPFLLDAETRFADRLLAFLPPPESSASPYPIHIWLDAVWKPK
jgi:hypothetical protein